MSYHYKENEEMIELLDLCNEHQEKGFADKQGQNTDQPYHLIPTSDLRRIREIVSVLSSGSTISIRIRWDLAKRLQDAISDTYEYDNLC